jgi:hypothetical protein
VSPISKLGGGDVAYKKINMAVKLQECLVETDGDLHIHSYPESHDVIDKGRSGASHS